MKYKFRKPHKCQNGHFNYLFFELHGDKLTNHRWGENACKCPKFEIGEGYTPCGNTEMYTGLTDKNGKEIYEGDIVRASHLFFNIKNEKMKVIYKNGCFCFKNVFNEDYKLLFATLNDIEIIGNIHDKELLESEVKL